MRPILLVLPLLSGCSTEVPDGASDWVMDGPMPAIEVEGAPSAFVLRDGLVLPPPSSVQWSGREFTYRFVEAGGELPYPPNPFFPDADPVYPNVLFVDGTNDPREAFVVQAVLCDGGYDPGAIYSILMPPRHAPTGDWVFDVDGSRCDGT